MFEEFRKYGLFANLKTCCFYQKEICFLDYVVSSQKVCLIEKKIDAIKA